MTRRPLAIALALALAALPRAARAAEYHVDAVIGSDATGDGSIASPWRTLTHALGRPLASGDRVRLAAGTYSPSTNGESFPLTVPEGISVSGAGAALTTLVATVAGDVLRATTGTLIGPFWEISDLALEGPGSTTASTGIALLPGRGQGPLVTRTRIAGFGTGVSVLLALDGAPDQSLDSRGFVDGNLIAGNGTGYRASVSLRNTPGRVRERTEVLNNWFSANGTAIRLETTCTGCDAGGVDLRTPVLNNTIVDTAGDAVAIANADCTGMASNGPDLTNNVIARSGGMGVRVDACSAPNPILTNAFWQNAGGGEGPVPENFIVDPLLDADGIHLSAASPCIDKGTTLPEPLTDIDGEPRPIDGDGDGTATTDIGADERVPPPPPALMRALLFGIGPIVPALATVYPFAPSNPLTPVVIPALAQGDPDPTTGILTNGTIPLALYQHGGDPALELRAAKEMNGETLRFWLW